MLMGVGGTINSKIYTQHIYISHLEPRHQQNDQKNNPYSILVIASFIVEVVLDEEISNVVVSWEAQVILLHWKYLIRKK